MHPNRPLFVTRTRPSLTPHTTATTPGALYSAPWAARQNLTHFCDTLTAVATAGGTRPSGRGGKNCQGAWLAGRAGSQAAPGMLIMNGIWSTRSFRQILKSIGRMIPCFKGSGWLILN